MFKPKRKNKKGSKYSKSRSSSQSNMNLLQKPGMKFFKQCPFSEKGAPIIDYKNVRVIRKYLSESGRILPSRITSVSQKKQRELSKAIKRARILALL